MNGYSQDSIVNYLDRNGKITSREKAIKIETIVKKTDSIWEYSKYRDNGILNSRSYFRTKEKKIKIGQSVFYSRNGKMTSLEFYDLNGLKNGKNQIWFDNGNKSSFGRYIKNKKEGVWRYYHFNGNIASKLYYKNDKLLKSVIFDETGQEIDVELIEKRDPKFKGGIKTFYKKVRRLPSRIKYKVAGKIFVTFIIDIDGKIKKVRVSNKLPLKVEKKIITFFEEIQGWSPRIHMNRELPMLFTIPLNFKKIESGSPSIHLKRKLPNRFTVRSSLNN
jgi:hypothetical protein